MPKYMYAANYTKEGLEGVRKEGAAARVAAVRAVAESVGGQLESFYFAFGDVDVYVVVDLPDDESAAAVSLTITSTGRVSTRTTKLLTVDEIDAAFGKSVQYRPPGG